MIKLLRIRSFWYENHNSRRQIAIAARDGAMHWRLYTPNYKEIDIPSQPSLAAVRKILQSAANMNRKPKISPLPNRPLEKRKSQSTSEDIN